jgi:hypothetical protein
VQRARDQLLARAALALDERGRIAAGDAADQLVDFLHRRGLADDLGAGLVLRARALAQLAQPLHQGLALDGLPRQQAQRIEVEGLGQVVVCAAARGLDGVGDGRPAGDDDDGGVAAGFAVAVQQIEAAHAGQVDVDERDVEPAAFELRPRFLGRSRGDHLVAVFRQRRRDDLANVALVVDDEDTSALSNSRAARHRFSSRRRRARAASRPRAAARE